MAEVSANLIPVFVVYFADFAHRFGSEVEGVARQYAERLIVHSVGHKGMMRGIEKLKQHAGKKQWFPNPEEFALLCKPTAEEAGIPSLQDVKDQIVEARGRYRFESYAFTHQIAEIINTRIGFDFYQLSAADFSRKLEKEYNHWLQRALKNDLPAPRAAIAYQAEPDLPPYLKNGAVTVSGALGKKIENLRQLARERAQKVELTNKKTV